MAQIKLRGTRGKGKVVLVDDRDAELLARHRWYLDRDGYPRTQIREAGRARHVHLHLLLLDDSGHRYRDHIDGNPLNNQRRNLRPATVQENNQNRGVHRNSKTGVKGVSPYRRGFRVTIHSGRKQHYLGVYPTLDLAAAAYNGAAIALFGAFARLNPIPVPEAVKHAAD